MLCKTCERTNKNAQALAESLLLYNVNKSIKIAECFTDKETHKIIYEDGLEEHTSIENHEWLHNTKGPALLGNVAECWYYQGDQIESASISENNTIKTESGQIGVILKLIEGKIYQALIGDEKFLVAII